MVVVEEEEQQKIPTDADQYNLRVMRLKTFLSGTIQSQSPLRFLRGQSDILRLIWIYICSEWWSLQLRPCLLNSVPNRNNQSNIAYLKEIETLEYYHLIDCPFIIIEENLNFPPCGSISSFSRGVELEQPISVHMMPFDLFYPESTLPAYLHGYLDIIYSCRKHNRHWNRWINELSLRQNPRGFINDEDEHDLNVLGALDRRIAYITIDERLNNNKINSQKGIRVTNLGSHLPPDVMGKKSIDYLDRNGIFIASNKSNTTALWNYRLHNTHGDMIGKHGSIERCRCILGKPDKLLQAGELIWMTDCTPYELLSLKENNNDYCQYFRLVVGEIPCWSAYNNTANPMGYDVPDNIPILYWNHYTLPKEIPIIWECGNSDMINIVKDHIKYHDTFYNTGKDIIDCSISSPLSQEVYDRMDELLSNPANSDGRYTKYFLEYF